MLGIVVDKINIPQLHGAYRAYMEKIEIETIMVNYAVIREAHDSNTYSGNGWGWGGVFHSIAQALS